MTCCNSIVELGSFENLSNSWVELLAKMPEPTFFDLPLWQHIWWSEFGSELELRIYAIRSDDGDLKMIAPLQKTGEDIAFLGGTDLCDYHDFLSSDRGNSRWLKSLVEELTSDDSLRSITLQSLPGNSPSISQFRENAEEFGWSVSIEQEDVAPRTELPTSWDEYLAGLRKKDRHELRRKLRRLEAAGDFAHYELTDPDEIDAAMDDFMRLHRMSTADKAEFMTADRESFFRLMSGELANEGITRLSFLEFEGVREATSLSFVTGGVRYLYNSGYNPAQSRLSVGLLNHALTLKTSIEQGIRVFDFMRGNESYKYHLGGTDREIFALKATR